MNKIKVWDLPIRIFHWSLVLLMAVCLYTSYNLAQYWTFLEWFGIERRVSGLLVHQYAGVGILILVLFRIIWGFVGSSHARFWDFLRGPKTILRYIRERTSPTEGHNPLGAYMVLLMLMALLAQTLSGLFLEDNSYYLAGDAPLASTIKGVSVTLFGEKMSLRSLLKEIHIYGRTLLIGLILLHLAAIALYTLLLKASLIRPMIVGTRTFNKAHVEGHRPLKYDNPLLGLILLLLIAAGTIYLLYY